MPHKTGPKTTEPVFRFTEGILEMNDSDIGEIQRKVVLIKLKCKSRQADLFRGRALISALWKAGKMNVFSYHEGSLTNGHMFSSLFPTEDGKDPSI